MYSGLWSRQADQTKREAEYKYRRKQEQARDENKYEYCIFWEVENKKILAD